MFPYLLEVKRADFLAQSMYLREEKEEELKQLEAIYKEVIANKDCTSVKMLAVNGSDLIAAGMKPGKELGAALQRLLEIVLEDPSLNTKEYLLSQISPAE